MKKTLLIILAMLAIASSCNSQTKHIESIVEREKILEDQLDYQKKLIYYHFYDILKSNYYQKNNIDISHGQDSINFSRLSILDYSFTIFDAIAYDCFAIYKDKRLQDLMDKWKNKYYLTPDYQVVIGDAIEAENELNKKGDVLFMKALDFYESEDLKLYIDSLRIVGKEYVKGLFDK